MWLPVLLLAQGLMIVSSPEPGPKSAPAARPIERHALQETPEALFAALTSGDNKRIVAAQNALGWEWMRGDVYGDIGLHAVQMDSEDGTERVLTLENAVAVLKREGDNWWLLGSFSCCGPSGRAAEPFSEWKELVWPGTKDLLVHLRVMGGTGVGRTDVAAYRIWRGYLYPVFQVEEDSYNMSETIQTRLVTKAEGHVLTERTRTVRNRTSVTCQAWNWNRDTFQFAAAQVKLGRCL